MTSWVTEMIRFSPRDTFWRAVNARLSELGLDLANNGEIADVVRRTTCPRQAAEFIQEKRIQRDRRTMGCHPRTMSGPRDADDPVWCWCGCEIIMGIGQCAECQEAEDMSGYDY